MPYFPFIHGITDKPIAEELLDVWCQALAQGSPGHDDAIDLARSG